jgi:hypothetical protein
VIRARHGAPRGGARATLHVLFLPLLLLAPVGCRTYDYHRSWYDPYDYGSYGYYHRHYAAPQVYHPVAPPVIVVPRIERPPLPAYIPPRPPERHFEHHPRSGGDNSRHLNRDHDHRRGR